MITALDMARSQHSTISYIVGDENYTWFHDVSGKKQLCSRHLKYFTGALPNFLRIHKRFLINPSHASHVDLQGRHLIMQSGERLPIARRRYGLFTKQFQSFRDNNP